MRLIAIDMDGTLLDSKNKLNNETVDYLINRIDDGQIKVVISTGRPLHGVTTMLPKRLMDKVSVIGLNGCIIVEKDKEIIKNHTLTEEEVLEIIDYGDELEADVVIMDAYDYYGVSGRISDIMVYDSGLNNTAVILKERHDLDSIPHWNKILFYFDDVDKITDLKETLPDYYRQAYDIEFSQPFLFEFLPKGINKGKVLVEYAESLGFPIENVVAIGDGLNDLTMLQLVGTSIAMKNSVSELFEVADHVTLSNDENGVIHAIENFVL